MTFAVLGLQRSGTNFLERLLRDNVEDGQGIRNAWRENGIWKHGYDFENKPEWNEGHQKKKISGIWGGQRVIDDLTTGVRWPIYIYKHPYNWLESITTKCVDIKGTNPGLLVSDDQDNFLGMSLEKLAKYWSDHTTYFFNAQYKIYRLSYESLIDSEETTRYHVENIAKFYNKKIKRADIMIAKKVPQSEQFDESQRNRYKDIEIRKFSWQHLKIINTMINKETLQKQGFQLITTEEDYWRHKVSPI